MDVKQKPTFYIHIGPYKTGSSTIQHFLNKNKELLLAQGLIYPKSGFFYEGQHLLVKDILNPLEDEPLQGGIDSLVNELRPYDKNVLISSESFHTVKDVETLYRLKNPLEAYYDFKVITVVRNQESHLISMWNSDMRYFRACPPYPKYVSSYINKKSFLNHKWFLSLFIEVFGENNLLLIPFRKDKGKAYLTEEISRLIGIDDTGFQHGTSLNISPSNTALELLRILPSEMIDLVDLSEGMEFAQTFVKSNELNLCRNLNDEKTYQEIQDAFAKDNQFLMKLSPALKHELYDYDEFKNEAYADLASTVSLKVTKDFNSAYNEKFKERKYVNRLGKKSIMEIVDLIYNKQNVEEANEYLKNEIDPKNLEHHFFKANLSRSAMQMTALNTYEKVVSGDIRNKKLCALLSFKRKSELQRDLYRIGLGVIYNVDYDKGIDFISHLIYKMRELNILNRYTLMEQLTVDRQNLSYLEVCSNLDVVAYSIGNKTGEILYFGDEKIPKISSTKINSFEMNNLSIDKNYDLICYNSTVLNYTPKFANSLLAKLNKNGVFILLETLKKGNKKARVLKHILRLQSMNKFNVFTLKEDHGITIIYKSTNKIRKTPNQINLDQGIKELQLQLNFITAVQFKKWLIEEYRSEN